MAINPMTKQLRQNLRAACMERNDVEAFALVCKILELEPGDKDLLAQRKEIGRRLFDNESKELTELIDAGDNERLVQAIQSLDRYVDRSYAEQSAVYKEANAIVTECLRMKAEEELEDKFQALQGIKDLKRRDNAATELEKFATNAGIPLSDKQLKFINSTHAELKKLEELERQMKKLEGLTEKAAELEERLSLLTQDFNKEAYDAIMTELTECSEAFGTLTSIPADLLAEPEERFRTIQAGVKFLRQQYIRKVRILRVVKTVVPVLVLGCVGTYLFLICTVGGKVKEIQERLQKPDIQYVQEVQNSFSSKLYKMVSKDFASELERCNQFLAERHRKQQLYSETLARLNELKKNINPTNSNIYCRELDMLAEIRTQYNKRFKEELDTRWNTLYRDLQQALFSFWDTRIAHYKSVSADKSIGEICAMYRDFSNEMAGLHEDQKREVGECYARVLVNKYSGYATMNEIELEKALEDLNQATGAGIPMDRDFVANVQSKLGTDSAMRKINRDCRNAQDLKSYAGIIRNNSIGYESLANKFPLSQLGDLADHPETLKNHAQLEELCNISGNANGSSVKRHIGSLSQVSQLADVFNGRTDAYMGSKSREMNGIIMELTQKSAGAWGKDYYMAECKGKIYIGKMSAINDTTYIRTIEDRQEGKCRAGSETKLNLQSFRASVGITASAMDNGQVLPVVILHNIATAKTNTPALVRFYLYKKVKQLICCYKNPAASGLELSQTLRADFEELDALNISADSERCWCTPYSATLERRCNSFLQKVASHNYLEEIKKNMRKIESARFNFVGYIQQDGSPQYNKRSDNVYYFDTLTSEMKPYTQGCHPEPFTPLFQLSTIK